MTGFQNVWIGYGLWVGAGIWAFIMLLPVRRRIAFLREREELTQEGTLGIEAQRCNILDFFPQPDNTLTRIWGHMNVIEVETRFIPQGNIKLHSLELHIGRHTFDAKRLPVIMIDHEDTYSIHFEVPNKILKQILRKPPRTYIRAMFNDRDCFSNNIPIRLVYEGVHED